MADIMMTQVEGTTHHYFALVNLDLGNLEPSVDLHDYLDHLGAQRKVVDAIQEDKFIEQCIKSKFEAQTTLVSQCIFKPGSYNVVVGPDGIVTERTIQLQITTSAVGDISDAIRMEFEFLHSGPR